MMDTIDAEVVDGKLILSPKASQESNRFCLFCYNQSPKVTLTTPGISSIEARNGSTIRGEKLPPQSQFALTLEDGSYADLAIDTDVLTAAASTGSSMNFEGQAKEAYITVEDGSRFNGLPFTIASSSITAIQGSSVRAEVSDTLNARAEYGSSILYRGDAEVTESARYGGEIEILR